MARTRTPRRNSPLDPSGTWPKPKLIALSVAAAFALSIEPATANPTGPTVVSGSASFAAQGNTLNVTNSANAIINWQSFSIGANEVTRFLQPHQLSAVLNRVVGAGGTIPQSVLNGVLSSNGHVYLLNPSGVVIGRTATIDVAGLVASSLNLSNEDFLAGKLKFTEVPGAGAIKNQGTIDAGPGGRVYLVGPSVENSGIIRSPQGEVVLAAGKSIELVSEYSPNVSVRITADAEEAKNLGTIIADSGRIGIHGAIVTQGGVAEASGAVVGPGGEIRLVASKDVKLEAGSVTAANGSDGGKVVVQAQAGTAEIRGTVEANGTSGKGGSVQALGVRVGVLGNGIIDASGDSGGGTVLVGGDYQGANPSVQNSQQTVIGKDGVIRADARETGNGGRVIAWSDGDTAFYGKISARGGANGGDGGFVETSGKGSLQAHGRVDVSAPKGKGGNWLLDPYTIDIIDSGYGNLDGFLPSVPATSYGSTVSVAAIQSAIYGGSVTLQAQAMYGAPPTMGDVNFDPSLTSPVNLSASNPSNNSFNIYAAGNINLNGKHLTNSGSINLSANYCCHPNGPTGTGSINGSGSDITSQQGSISLSGHNVTARDLSASSSVYASAQNLLNLRNVTSTNSYVNLYGDAGATVGNVSANNSNVHAESNVGFLTIGNVDAAYDITLYGGTGIGAGNLTSTDGSVWAESWGGSVTVGDVSAGGSSYYVGFDPFYAGYCHPSGRCSEWGEYSIALLAANGVTAGSLTNAPWGERDYTDIFVLGGSGSVSTGAINSRGGNVFIESYSPATVSVTGGITTTADGGEGNWSGDVNIYSAGNLTVSGAIVTKSLSEDYWPGRPGDVWLKTDTGTINVGSINTSGGSALIGGDGAEGGAVFLGRASGAPPSGGVAIQVGDIDTRSGSGANGSGWYGYDAGWWGGDVTIATDSVEGGPVTGSVTLGNVNTSGGAGGAGDAGYGGGWGGDAGNISIQASSASFSSLTADGGAGGAGGSGAAGGPGGWAGTIYVDQAASSFGAISAVGGAGGVMGAGGTHGYGGSGGLVEMYSAGPMAFSGGASVLGGCDGGGASCTADGTLIVAAGGAITQGAAIQTDDLDVSNSGAGDVALTNAGNYLPSAVGSVSAGNLQLVTSGTPGANASVTASGNISLTNLTAGGSYDVSAASGSGSVSVVSDVLVPTSVSAATLFQWYSSNSAPIGVNQAFFTNVSAPTVKLGDASTSSSIALAGPLDFTGIASTLNLVTNGGAITQSGGGLTVGALSANGGAVTLTQAANAVGTVQGSASSGGFAFVNAGSFSLGGASLSAAQSIALTSGSGSISGGGTSLTSATGGVSVGAANGAAVGNISAASAVSLNSGTGALSAGNVSGDSVALNGAGIAVGDVTSSGGGALGVDSGAGTLALGNVASLGGAVTLAGQSVTVGSIDARALGTGTAGSGDVDVQSPGNVTVGGDILTRSGENTGSSPNRSGDVSLASAGGSVSVAGTIDTSGASGAPGAAAGVVNLSGSTVSVGAISADGGDGVGGNGGAGGAVTITGLTSAGAISASGGDASTGFTGGAGGIVTLDAPGGLSLGGLNTLSGLNGDGTRTASGQATINAAGGVTQSGALSTDYLAVYTLAPGDIVLTNPSNFLPTVYAGTPGITGAVSVHTSGILNPYAAVNANGNILLRNLAAGGTYLVDAASSAGSVSVASDSISIGTVSTPTFFEWYSPNSAPIGINQSFFSGISAPLIRVGNAASSSPITLVGAVNLPSTLSLITSGGLITQSGGGLTAAGLNADGGDVLLTNAGNQVGVLQGRATNADFQFTSAGNIVLGTADAGNPTPGVSSNGFATLASLGGSILHGVAGGYDVSAPVVQLSAAGSIGTPAAALQARTVQLDASAGAGIDLVTNQFNPQVVIVTTLENLTSGDINLTAYGGANVQNLVVNSAASPGGNVTISTLSPLDVIAGINASGNIQLLTGGSPSNDMFLDYVFTYGGGSFAVFVGETGALTLGPNFQGPVTQLNVALPPSGAPPSEGPSIVVQGQNPIENLVQGLDQAVNFTVVYDPLDEETKKQQDKKLPSCKG